MPPNWQSISDDLSDARIRLLSFPKILTGLGWFQQADGLNVQLVHPHLGDEQTETSKENDKVSMIKRDKNSFLFLACALCIRKNMSKGT